MRTVFWEHGQLKMIDQRILPGRFEVVSYSDHKSVAKAITDMVVRGAPAIGAAAAFGLALAGFESASASSRELIADLQAAASTLKAARPTAVNLAWAVDRILSSLSQRERAGGEGDLESIRHFILSEAQRIADEDVEINKRMAEHGAALIDDGDTIIHHCNTGALATVDWGTALGVIRTAHEQGKRIHVLVDEDGDEHNQHPEKSEKQVVCREAKQERYKPEQWMHTHGNSGDGKSQIITRGRRYLK